MLFRSPLISRESVDRQLNQIVDLVNDVAAFGYRVLRSQDTLLTIKVQDMLRK